MTVTLLKVKARPFLPTTPCPACGVKTSSTVPAPGLVLVSVQPSGATGPSFVPSAVGSVASGPTGMVMLKPCSVTGFLSGSAFGLEATTVSTATPARRQSREAAASVGEWDGAGRGTSKAEGAPVNCRPPSAGGLVGGPASSAT